MSAKRTVTGVLTNVERMKSSYYGNPRFALTLDGKDKYRTGVDAAVGYEVENHKVGRVVTLTLSGARDSVIGMRYGN